MSTQHLGPHETAANAIKELMFWRYVAIRAMQALLDEDGHAEILVPSEFDDLVRDADFQDRLVRARITDDEMFPGWRSVELEARD